MFYLLSQKSKIGFHQADHLIKIRSDEAVTGEFKLQSRCKLAAGSDAGL